MADELRRFWVGSVVLFVLMFLLQQAERLAGFPREFYYFLNKWFTDLMEYPGTFKLLHTAAFYRNPDTPSVAYPPLGALAYAGLYATGRPLLTYLLLAALWLVLAWWGASRLLREKGLPVGVARAFSATVIVCSFPIAILLQTGNIELFVWMFSAVGVWLFVRGRDDAAAAAWGLAAGIKLYPIVLLVLLLGRKRYRAFVVGVGVFVLASVLVMWWMGPTISAAWHGSLQNVFGYQGKKAGEWSLHELAANHSIFILVKFVAMVAHIPLIHLSLIYYAVGGVLFALAYFGKLQRMPVPNQVLAVCLFMVMLPTVSYPYALVHLYAPWLLLMCVAVRSWRAGTSVRDLNATLCLLLPVFGSFTLMTFPKLFLFGGMIQAGLLLLLFVAALRFPFGPEAYDFSAAAASSEAVAAS